jgi:phage shock protein PspC (stress-responsive transcriptional regulator)
MSTARRAAQAPGPIPSQARPTAPAASGLYRPAATRRLERKRQGRWVAGVCAGLADYLKIDATVVRVVITVLALFGGLGPLAYVVCWVLMPEEGDTESIAERLMNSTGGR